MYDELSKSVATRLKFVEVLRPLSALFLFLKSYLKILKVKLARQEVLWVALLHLHTYG